MPVNRKNLFLTLTICSAVAGVALLYFLFAPGLNQQFTSQILFHPDKRAGHVAILEKINDVKGEEVFFTAEKGKNAGEEPPQLNGWIYKNPKSNVIVIFNHGNTGNVAYRIWKSESILRSGASLFLYDYRGYGRSDGYPTVEGVVQDGLAAFDFLVKTKGYEPGSIVLYGESLGTAVCTEVARQRNCGGIIYQSAPASAESLCKEQAPLLQIYPHFLFFKGLENEHYVRGSHAPLLFVACEEDEYVPFQETVDLYTGATAPKELLRLPQSSHNNFSKDLQLYEKAMTEFFQRTSIATSVKGVER